MKKDRIKGIRFIIVCFAFLILYRADVPAAAASFSDMNHPSVFVKQQDRKTCTLASAVMLVRRASFAAGNPNWSSITESSMRSTAWLEGCGLYHNFTYAGVRVSHARLNGGSGNVAQLKSLLKEHPEGIMIYDRGVPHAILITDYTNGTFYCADPAKNIASGRIPVSAASITINNADDYWYVSSPKVTISGIPSAPSPSTCSHTWDGGIVTKKATIDRKGSKTFTCKKCGLKKVTEIPVLYIKPGTSLVSVRNSKKGKLSIRWKQNKKVKGYQIQYGTSSSFQSGVKTVTISKWKTVSKMVSVKKGRTYYIRIRTYTGNKNYTSWGKKKKMKIKK